jgi:tetratricopeptide (TPR) repeat protein
MRNGNGQLEASKSAGLRLGMALREWRLQRGLTLDDIATDERLWSTSTLSNVERGRDCPSLELVVHYSQLLRPDPPELFLQLYQALREVGEHRKQEARLKARRHRLAKAGLDETAISLPPPSSLGAAVIPVSSAAVHLLWVDERGMLAWNSRLVTAEEGVCTTDRRDVLRGGLAAVLLAPSERLERALAGTSRVDAVVLDELAAQLVSYRRLDDRLGARAVLGPVVGQLHALSDLLEGSLPQKTRIQLISLSGETAQLAGWIYEELGQFPVAQRYYQLAGQAAEEAGNHALGAYVLLESSRILIRNHESAQALDLLKSARGLMMSGTPARVRAYRSIIEAKAQTDVGEVAGSFRALDQAEAILPQTRQADDPSWLYWLDQAYLDTWKGQCCMRLGRLAEAETALDVALAKLDPSFVRDRGALLAYTGTVRAGQQEPDEACRLAGEALAIALDTGSAKGVQRIRELRAELDPWSTTPAVRALDEQLAAA